MKKYLIVIGMLASGFGALSQSKKAQPAPINDRSYWLAQLDKVARPVMSNLAAGTLRQNMPVTLSPKVDNAGNRAQVAYLEAFGRVLAGIAPWMESEAGNAEEKALRQQYRDWAVKGVAQAVDTAGKDYMRFTGGQPLVDASFMALGLVRCPWLWAHLSPKVQADVVAAFKATRSIVPGYNNWILFSGMIEAFFCKYGIEYDGVRIDYGIREFANNWYVGDGVYSDGAQYHWDYYNSYVIQPYLGNILAVLRQRNPRAYDWYAPKFDQISKRYAVLQERMINTDGSFPVTGRSITYRGGAFHHLADMSLRKQLPQELKPAQVRGALTAVVKKTLEAPSTFTKDGWLNIGLAGHQPGLSEGYINTGSIYLCTFIFLPLGLPETDDFWAAPAEPWTAVKVWNGQDLQADHAVEIK
ncbi:DUF2264 domain-containing protein [Paraflavitalea sp. CAU 1676]|uniref:DUF2264 domain-containing protein n=1 Tax=Paraflavitalea sp. CAU 1676 TaxID=3032598 RepID=UPI0023D9A0D6|nr:DUF2264 domain-containing protein [Paraflavitalea sp. CAU 1676]MDF2192303.1 DUF2264 domain-containing protein [Paraflavitalea sp. CAU 1676]